MKRENVKYVTALPGHIKCVGIIEHKGDVLVATENAVYKLVDKTLKPLLFEVEDIKRESKVLKKG